MTWTAIVPLNYGRECKTRLAGHLTVSQRILLVERMARHVLGILSTVPAIDRLCLLSPECPPFASDLWHQDGGRGLNAELGLLRARFSSAPVLFIHADLPLLTKSDVEALLDAAVRSGAALAPDRAGLGTNALALIESRSITPCFGPDSLRLHKTALGDATLVEREGLALDVDEPDCLRMAIELGFVLVE